MVRIITTSYGQLLADVKQDEGFTVILDSKTFTPIAKINSIELTRVMSSLRRLGNVMKKKASLEAEGTILLTSFEFKEKKKLQQVLQDVNQTVEAKPVVVRRKRKDLAVSG